MCIRSSMATVSNPPALWAKLPPKIAVISVTRHGMNVERVAIDRSRSPLSHEVVHLCKYFVLIEILTKKCSVVLDWKVGPNAGIASHADWALLDVII